MATGRTALTTLALVVTALGLAGCSGGSSDDSLDPATLGRVPVDESDPRCVALRRVVEAPPWGHVPTPFAELSAASQQRDDRWNELVEIDPEFADEAAVSQAWRQTVLDAWGDDGTELVRRADQRQMRALYLAADEALARGESVPTRRDIDENGEAMYDALQECAVGEPDLPVLTRGDASPPDGFVLYRADGIETTGAGAVTTDGSSTWSIDGVDGASLEGFRVSPDGTQVLATALDSTDGSSSLVTADVDALREGTDDPWTPLLDPTETWTFGRWRSDGTILALRGPAWSRQLVIVDPDTGDALELGEPVTWSSGWSPGPVVGDHVVESGGPAGNGLRRTDIDSGEVTTVLEFGHCSIADTTELGDDRVLLTVGCDDARANGVYSVRSDGTDLRAVFTGTNSSAPRLSADGEWMAFNHSDEPDGEPRAWIARVDGTEARPLGDSWAGFTTWVDAAPR